MNSITSSLVSLKLLGSASVDGPDGPVLGRGARGRRLALLAILAAARGRPVTRDKLLAILWPDSETERARPLLSDSLYIVRNALGEDAIVATGDELRLNAERVASDVDLFERLLSDGQFERAVAEYAGPFLDGFYVSGAAEFERWVDGERARLAESYANALGALAAAKERVQDWPAAVTWLRRLAAHDPYAGRIAVQLMRALQASGNRAGALQHARIHSALLREEFSTEPDTEVVTLVEQLKSESASQLSPSGLPPLTLSPTSTASPSAAPLSALAPSAHSTSPPALSAPATSPSSQQVAIRDVAHFSQLETHGAHNAGVPAGIHPFQERRANVSINRVPLRARWRLDVRLAAIAVVVLAVAGAVAFRGGDGGRDSRAPLPARPSALAPERSIAVLPFENVGQGTDLAYFSDGLTEEIIGLLGRVDGLRVAARSSSFALRTAGLEARRMGDTLHVATLLEGSVRREGNRVRVTAQLVDVANGYQLWSESYDRRVEDVIALQNDIASAIVNALELKLGAAKPDNALQPAHNTEAYDLYLRGVYARSKLTGEELSKGVDYFDRAIRIDSAYAPAYAGKATTLGPMVWHGHLPRAQGGPLMRAAARRAVQLDETLPESHVALGMYAFYFEWDWPAAEREFRRAVELNPNDSHAHHFLANYLRAMGRFDDAIVERERAVALDPLSVRMRMLLGSDHFFAGNNEFAADHFRRASELEPRSPAVLGLGPGVNLGLGHVYERQGKFEEALQEYLKVDSLTGVASEELVLRRTAFTAAGMRGYWRRRVEQMERGVNGASDPVHIAWMWARVGDNERTIQSLERAYREKNISLVFLAVQPDFAAVHADPRVVSILKSMRLSDKL